VGRPHGLVVDRFRSSIDRWGWSDGAEPTAHCRFRTQAGVLFDELETAHLDDHEELVAWPE
jgi:hypothetical protein